ncbi:MAG: phosphoribosylamine--glycine ligase [Peptococcaceae bacterium]|jgi:phosphoribosylamine--glycine ligase|nr:phosphoribosylamine--glycine ligase [Peptococcaceae bacterium]
MKKKVLIIGSGGREHALAWKLQQSPQVGQLYVAPGNAGTKEWNVSIPVNDLAALADFAQREQIDLTVVGPEEPLCLGIVNLFRAKGLRVFGPTGEAAQLEGSKSFAKSVMDAAKVPTAQWKVFERADTAKEYIRQIGAPCVVKADGLAAGKGVVVAQDVAQAEQAVDAILAGSFGDAGSRIVIEECLQGQEVSLLCFTDGRACYPMVPVQDHKRALDGDQGLNTGGMGTYTPPPFWSKKLQTKVLTQIVEPTLREMRRAGTPFAGVLYVGLMITEQGPKVLEYNARFGDPETQVIMARLKSDLFPVLWACTEQTLSTVAIEWREEVAVCVVMAAPGYPQAYPKRIPLHIPEVASAAGVVFHAGTAWDDESGCVSDGGRVLGVTATGKTLTEARMNAYVLVEKIGFPGAHFRWDIGVKGLGSIQTYFK